MATVTWHLCERQVANIVLYFCEYYLSNLKKKNQYSFYLLISRYPLSIKQLWTTWKEKIKEQKIYHRFTILYTTLHSRTQYYTSIYHIYHRRTTNTRQYVTIHNLHPQAITTVIEQCKHVSEIEVKDKNGLEFPHGKQIP